MAHTQGPTHAHGGFTPLGSNSECETRKSKSIRHLSLVTRHWPVRLRVCALVIVVTVMGKVKLRAQGNLGVEYQDETRKSKLEIRTSRLETRKQHPGHPALGTAYGNLPISFEANRGQAAPEVDFLSRGKGYALFLTGSGLALSLEGQPRNWKLETGDSKFETRNSKLPTGNWKLETGNWKSGIRDPESEAQERFTRHPTLVTRHWSQTGAFLSMRLVGASTHAKVTGLDSLPGRVNYFIGKDPAEWRTNIPTYSRVLYRSVYPGVDLVYYGKSGQLEYDFVVAPGSDPGAITLDVAASIGGPLRNAATDAIPEVIAQGVAFRTKPECVRKQKSNKNVIGRSRIHQSADPVASTALAGSGGVPARGRPQGAAVRIEKNGDLVVQVGGGEVRFHKPVVYQEQSTADSQQSKAPLATDVQPSSAAPRSKIQNPKFLDGRFVLRGRNRVGFEVASYDRTRPLVIDPTLTYSTYLGGESSDTGNGIAVDSSGNAYVAGQSCSAAFSMVPVRIGTGGDCDAFVAKLNAEGTGLTYLTFVGGSGGDTATGIAVDSAGNAYVTGYTNSSADFPTTAGAYQKTYGGGNLDAFAFKVNAAGSALLYSTYLGGSDTENSGGIATDSSGNAYVTGQTFSANFPTTAGSFQPAYAGAGDAYLVKLNAAGSELVYSTFLGSPGEDSGTGVAVDSLGAAFVTGITSDAPSRFPTRHRVQPFCGGWNGTTCPINPRTNLAYNDAFVAKIAPDGSGLVYSTYLGGANDDSGASITLDTLGSAYVTGTTSSVDFPTAVGALQTALRGHDNAFVTKVDPLGGSFVYSTYLGGSGVDKGVAIAVDVGGVAYVTGGTTSSDFPTVSAIQVGLAGPLAYPGDAFVSKVNAFGSGLIYSSFLGGGDNDVGNGIAVDSALAVYVTGSTSSSDFPTVPFVETGSPCPSPPPLQCHQAGTGDAFVTKLNALTSAVAEISPRNLTFGNQGLGIPSAPQTVTITNSGDAPLLVSSIVEVGDIYQPPGSPPPPPVDQKDWVVTTDNCTGVSVAALSTCTFSVTFVPNPTAAPGGLGVGARTGTITVSDNATTPTQVIQLAGNGVSPPAVLLRPTSLSFANQLSGTISTSQTVTLSNTGGFPLAITLINIPDSNSFAQTNTCGSSLGPGGSCTISVIFSPKTTGTITGTLTIDDDATNTPQTVGLSGIGTAPAPIVSLSTTALTFGNEKVTVTRPSQPVTFTNSGTAPLTITNSATTGDFAQSNNCPASLAPKLQCVINVTFTPTAVGNRYGSMTLTDNASDSPQTILLSGVGLATPLVGLSANSLSFAAQSIGTASTAQTLTLTNTGSAALTLTSIVTSGDYAQTNNCPPTLAAGTNCTINVTFTPTAAGTRSGSLTITDNAPGSPQVLALGGNGTDFAVSATPSTLAVLAGNSANFTVKVTPDFGFTGSVLLSCTGYPPGGSCYFSPNPVSPDGKNPSTAGMTVTTTVRSQVPPRLSPPRWGKPPAFPWLLWLLLIVTINLAAARGGAYIALFAMYAVSGTHIRRAPPGMSHPRHAARPARPWRLWPAFGLLMLLVLAWGACGGGGGMNGGSDPNGTQTGNYTLTISAASGPVTHTTTVTLTVQ